MEQQAVHDLRCWPEYYWPVVTGKKPFEIRKNDRDFKVGDFLKLREWEPSTEQYSGQESQLTEITYITDFAQQPGYVVMGLRLTVGEVADAPTLDQLLTQATQDLPSLVIQPATQPKGVPFCRLGQVARGWEVSIKDAMGVDGGEDW